MPRMNILVTFLIVLMGISCFSGQVLFIREFLILFNGNELIIGLILANWLLLQAAGSFIGGIISLRLRSPRNTYSLTLLATGILFPLSIMAARTAKTLAHAAPGQEIGIVAIMFTSLLIMAPLGMFLGGQFPLICRLSQDTRNQSLITATGKSYFWEAIGFGLGGIMITYILIAHTNALYSAFFIGWSNILAAGMLVFANRKKPAAGFGIIILAIAGIIGYQYPAETADRLSLRWQWKSLNIVDSQNSAYGNISVINQREQHTFYYDGAPFMSLPLPDIRFIRDIVSFPLAAVIAPDKVAVIGSGLGGIIDTILQFPVQRVDYAEIDPLIIIMARRYSTETTRRELADKRLIIHHHDGRLFLRNTPERF
jgi:Spermidine synthase